ncbi:hypothetical protein, variant [Fonticula alba]|uniref:Uncharacterized protein n=1 Tax=Fonticula alba TaxID=691883 RepID=A0A058ZIE7_FONAL|nr:hypothetical protein, variant [Fonticula alba]KCV73292.1 hypothetical protein, variant [Fonticula alba]|eukprot:XP_009492993.1 hypothetical protein, variant [Fonticula alba]
MSQAWFQPPAGRAPVSATADVLASLGGSLLSRAADDAPKQGDEQRPAAVAGPPSSGPDLPGSGSFAGLLSGPGYFQREQQRQREHQFRHFEEQQQRLRQQQQQQELLARRTFLSQRVDGTLVCRGLARCGLLSSACTGAFMLLRCTELSALSRATLLALTSAIYLEAGDRPMSRHLRAQMRRLFEADPELGGAHFPTAADLYRAAQDDVAVGLDGVDDPAVDQAILFVDLVEAGDLGLDAVWWGGLRESVIHMRENMAMSRGAEAISLIEEILFACPVALELWTLLGQLYSSFILSMPSATIGDGANFILHRTSRLGSFAGMLPPGCGPEQASCPVRCACDPQHRANAPGQWRCPVADPRTEGSADPCLRAIPPVSYSSCVCDATVHPVPVPSPGTAAANPAAASLRPPDFHLADWEVTHSGPGAILWRSILPRGLSFCPALRAGIARNWLIAAAGVALDSDPDSVIAATEHLVALFPEHPHFLVAQAEAHLRCSSVCSTTLCSTLDVPFGRYICEPATPAPGNGTDPVGPLIMAEDGWHALEGLPAASARRAASMILQRLDSLYPGAMAGIGRVAIGASFAEEDIFRLLSRVSLMDNGCPEKWLVAGAWAAQGTRDLPALLAAVEALARLTPEEAGGKLPSAGPPPQARVCPLPSSLLLTNDPLVRAHQLAAAALVDRARQTSTDAISAARRGVDVNQAAAAESVTADTEAAIGHAASARALAPGLAWTQVMLGVALAARRCFAAARAVLRHGAGSGLTLGLTAPAAPGSTTHLPVLSRGLFRLHPGVVSAYVRLALHLTAQTFDTSVPIEREEARQATYHENEWLDMDYLVLSMARQGRGRVGRADLIGLAAMLAGRRLGPVTALKMCVLSPSGRVLPHMRPGLLPLPGGFLLGALQR